MTLQQAINDAYAADAAFSAAIRAAGFKSRWDWDYRQPGAFVDLRAAYRNKVEADSLMHQAFVNSRNCAA